MDFAKLVGTQVAGYEITAMLGEGGMAVVFRAENLVNRRLVRALKIVRPELASRKEFQARFSEEAITLEQLAHPNVVRFFGLRRDGELLVMELEYLAGEALSSVVRKSARPPEIADAVRWMDAAARGVASAHALGIVHRDLKPDNLFLTKEGTIKVLDFGIARAVDDADRAERLTTAGTVPGSPPYMAPEVCEGGIPEATADVYALGITLFEVLIGHHPFSPPGAASRSSLQFLRAHVQDELPKLHTLRPDAPVALETVLAKATAKNPAKRYRDARELSEALAAITAGLGVANGKPDLSTQFTVPTLNVGGTPQATETTSRPTGTARPPWVYGTAGVAALALAIGGWVATRPGGADAVPPECEPVRLAAQTAVEAVALARAGTDCAHQREQLDELLEEHAHSPAACSEHVRAIEQRAVEVAEACPPETLPAPPAAEVTNTWVMIPPAAPVRQRFYDEEWGEYRTREAMPSLGVSSDRAAEDIRGFRPRRGIVAPSSGYEIQQHEVTWGEMEAFMATLPDESRPTRPEWLSSEAHPERFPVTGITWSLARQYCTSIEGRLPTEEEWEWAARRSESGLLANPWGTGRIDLDRTHAYAGPRAHVAEVMHHDQDRTPGTRETALFDMLGNAQEWTVDLVRADTAGEDESWVQTQEVSYRTVRGFPLLDYPPASIQSEGLAYRDSLCASGACPATIGTILAQVGFRCVR